MSEAADTEPPPTEKPVCLLGLPHSGSMTPATMLSLTNAGSRCRIELGISGSSLLCHNFNQLWCQALNRKVDEVRERPSYFAMHHSDLAAPPNWLDDLLTIMGETGATMVSAVAAIKDFRGLTSTALLDVKENTLRRVTVHELETLPETFDAAMLAQAWGLPTDEPDRFVLCANTGLWVCDFRGEWVEQVAFENGDRIERKGDEFVPLVFSEDWLFSSTLAAKGLKVVVTRKVPLIHFGQAPFALGHGNKPWGHTKEDSWFSI